MDIGHGPHVLHPHDHHHDHHNHDHSEVSPAAGNISFKTENHQAGHHDGMSGHGHAHHMSMSFHTGVDETILFKFWHSQTTMTLIVSCFIIFLVAVLYEGLKFYREWLFKKCRRRSEGGNESYQHYHDQQFPPQYPQTTTQTFVFRPRAPASPSRSSKEAANPTRTSIPTHVHIPPIFHASAPARLPPTDPTDESPNRKPFPKYKIWINKIHLVQTFLHMLQVFISFLLMLVFMTYNVWLCVAVVLGAGVGYFIFFAYSDNVLEHCN